MPGARAREADLRDCAGAAVKFPTTADGWALPEWRAYWCHTDSPWISERLRGRIRDFTTVLGCRYPTVTDIRSPQWGKLRCGRWRRGATASAITVVRGNWTCRRSSSACVTRGCPVFSRAAPAAWRT